MPLKYYDEFILQGTEQEDRQICCVDFSPDSRYIAYGSRERLTIVSLRNGQPEPECKIIGASRITALLWLPDQRDTLICAYHVGIIAKFTLNTDSNYVDIKLTFAQNHKITHLGIDNEKSRLATGTGEDIRVWVQNKDVWDEKIKLSAPSKTGDNVNAEVLVTAIHWSHSDTLFVSYKFHGVQVWDVDTGQVITTLLNTASAMGCTALSPDGVHLAVAMHNFFDVYDTKTRLPLTALRPAAGLNAPVLFVLGGRTILGASNSASARLWNSVTATKLATLEHSIEHGDKGRIVALAATDNPKENLFRIATASSERVVVWKAREVNIEFGMVDKRRENKQGRVLWPLEGTFIKILCLLAVAALIISREETIWRGLEKYFQ